ncbi:hypothetical protein ABFS83_10G068500 [Erythranthe nasuta]
MSYGSNTSRRNSSIRGNGGFDSIGNCKPYNNLKVKQVKLKKKLCTSISNFTPFFVFLQPNTLFFYYKKGSIIRFIRTPFVTKFPRFSRNSLFSLFLSADPFICFSLSTLTILEKIFYLFFFI